MKRREFITLLCGSIAGFPISAPAQQPSKLPIIGFLGANTPSVQIRWTGAFVERLHELGWIEGRNVAVEYRWAGGRLDRSPEIIDEFVRLKVDVIVTHGTANVRMAKQATSVIPIVFAAISDPVGDNLVASLSRPGGNITGLSNQAPDLAGKRLELLRQIVSGFRRLAVFANAESPASQQEIKDVQGAARALGLEIEIPEIRRAEDIAPAIESVTGHAEAIYVQSDPLFNFNRARISDLALAARLPTVTGFRDFVDAGGLLSYGPNFPDLFRRAAEYVDKILRGAKPGEIPVEQPTKFELAINLKAAKALGLVIPPGVISIADEVIE